MKKLFFSVLSTLAIITSVNAQEKQMVVNVGNSTNAGTATTDGKFSFTDATSGITLEGWTFKPDEQAFGLSAAGGYIAVTANTKGLQITQVDVTAFTTATGRTITLQGKTAETPYTYTAALSQAWTGANPATPGSTTGNGSYVMTNNTASKFTYEINSPAFVLYNNNATGQIRIEQVMIHYKELTTPQMSFSPGVVHATLGQADDLVTPTLTISDPAEQSAWGEITYTSSNPAIVSVDATTGAITAADIKGVGSVEITATMAATENYRQGTASYTVVVFEPANDLAPATQIFDFTTLNAYGMTTQTSGSTFETKVKEIVSSDDMVKLRFNGQYRSYRAAGGAYELRMQPNATFTVEVPEGCKITKIGLVATGGVNTDVAGTYTPVGNSTVAGIWIPAADATEVTSVTFTATSQANISEIYVLYEGKDLTLKTPELSFAKVVYSLNVDEPTSVNAVTNPDNLDVTYEIEGLSASDYTITETDGALEVTVNVPGAYTLKATSAATDEYREGFAILKLNVFAKLALYNDGVEVKEGSEVNTKTEVTLTMDLPALATLFYQIVADQSAEPTATTMAADDQLAGYTESNGTIVIPANTMGTLNFYVANYGSVSPVRSIKLSPTAAIDSITVEDENAEAVYYNLNGIRIANPAQGQIYICKKGNKVNKIIF